ncbi:unnamed protein product [Toxocara canis]|uniref:DOMON domain-containing protein n=1 Tax=Toxocara canis TaxID=6265 RepID=A0A183VGK6_TOXCA|nr:unnamed protein product [Toxocara canis]
MNIDGLPEMFTIQQSGGIGDRRRTILTHIKMFHSRIGPINKHHILTKYDDYKSHEVVLVSVDDDDLKYWFKVEYASGEDVLYGYSEGSAFKDRIILKASNFSYFKRTVPR